VIHTEQVFDPAIPDSVGGAEEWYARVVEGEERGRVRVYVRDGPGKGGASECDMR
jgi:hypothetical protein